MREAEVLCEALDDQYRLGRVFSYTARSFFAVGDHTARWSPVSML